MRFCSRTARIVEVRLFLLPWLFLVVSAECIAQAPVLTTQPSDVTVAATYRVAFTVAISSATTAQYQWYKNGAPIAGATGASFVIASSNFDDAGRYSVEVMNASGNTTSRLAILTVTSPLEISTFAGRRTVGNVNGPVSTARFDSPLGVAADFAGNIYVTDKGNGSVRKISPSGFVTTFAVQLWNPSGICVDSLGSVYVSDSTNHVIRKITPEGNVTTVAGRLGSPGSANGVGDQARFSSPFGIACTPDGALFVVDRENHTIRKISTTGEVTTLAGTPGVRGSTDGAGGAALFNDPHGIALDQAGMLYVADTANDAIRTITPGGLVSTLAGQPGAGGSADGVGRGARFSAPVGIVVRAAGLLYVADRDNSTIRAVTAAGVVSTIAGQLRKRGSVDGPSTIARFTDPTGLAFDRSGDLLVTDPWNNCIRKVDASGALATLAGLGKGKEDGFLDTARFDWPIDVACDRSGNVFVADLINHCIRKITPGGYVSTFAGRGGERGSADGVGPLARFDSPLGVAVDDLGNVYVADDGNLVLRKISASGAVTTLAGLAGNKGDADGTGSGARFDGLSKVALDTANNIYVVCANNVVRKVSPTGVVTTLAGRPGVQGSSDGVGSNASFKGLGGVAVDRSGNIFVTDEDNNTIRKITPDGAVSTFAGLIGGGSLGSADGVGANARFSKLKGLAIDRNDNLYVCDFYGGAIRKVTPTAVVTTVAGRFGAYASTDGLGQDARLFYPTGISVGPNDEIYVADDYNSIIRKGVFARAPSADQSGLGKVLPNISVPGLLPPGADVVEARSLAEQRGGGVIVAVSGLYPGSSVSSRSIVRGGEIDPSYTNPQPYSLSYVVRLLSNGQPDPLFTSTPGADGTVNSICVQVDGRILVGGTFQTYNGRLFRNLARLTSDGLADLSFDIGSGATGQVNSVVVQADGRILVGGAFSNFSAQTPSRSFLVRLNSNGTVDTSYAPAINGTVNVLAVQSDGKLVVGGDFTSVGGLPRGRLARLLSSGALDPTFDTALGANDSVVALLVQADGKVVAAGDFTEFAGQTRSRIVRLTTSGSVDSGFAAATVNGAILSLGAEREGGVICSGSFTEINSIPRARIARFLPDGSLDRDFDPAGGANAEVRAVLPRTDGTVFLAGLFSEYQGTAVNSVVAVLSNAVSTRITYSPRAVAASVNRAARFIVEATGTGQLSYQWYRDGEAISNANASTLTVPKVSPALGGVYQVRVTSAFDSVLSREARLTVSQGGVSVLSNISARAETGQGGSILTVGFVVSGEGSKAVLIRSVGPSLGAFGVTGVLPDPRLRLFSNGVQVAENLSWDLNTQPLATRVGAFPLPPFSLDASLGLTLPAGGYTAQVDDQLGQTGVVLVECYDADESPTSAPRSLRNLSIRSKVGAGDKILIAGLVVSGDVPATVLVRCVGPGLSPFGLQQSELLTDPVLTILKVGGAVVATSDDWGRLDSAPEVELVARELGAFPVPRISKDAALLAILPPGSYTLQCSGKDGATGIAIVEAYVVP